MKFNFLHWMNMNMALDIAFLVFAIAVVWKFRRQQKLIAKQEEIISDNVYKIAMHKMFCQDLAKRIDLQTNSILELNSDIEKLLEESLEIRDDLTLTMRNPQEARRVLKERVKEDIINQ